MKEDDFFRDIINSNHANQRMAPVHQQTQKNCKKEYVFYSNVVDNKPLIFDMKWHFIAVTGARFGRESDLI